MSIDWRFEKVCDHRIVAEPAALDDDLKTIRFPRPIASKIVFLRVNGVDVPDGHPRWGFQIFDDELSVPNRRKRKLVINTPSKALDDIIDITYFTYVSFCPKCHALRLHDDFEWEGGQPILVGDSIKLTQEVKKGVITILGSNPFHTWIGTRIVDRIGEKVVDVRAVKAAILDEITVFLENYKSVQSKQIQSQQAVTPREVFLRVIELKVEPTDPVVPIVFDVLLRFQDATGEVNQAETQLILPFPPALLDDPFQQVGR